MLDWLWNQVHGRAKVSLLAFHLLCLDSLVGVERPPVPIKHLLELLDRLLVPSFHHLQLLVVGVLQRSYLTVFRLQS